MANDYLRMFSYAVRMKVDKETLLVHPTEPTMPSPTQQCAGKKVPSLGVSSTYSRWLTRRGREEQQRMGSQEHEFVRTAEKTDFQ